MTAESVVLKKECVLVEERRQEKKSYAGRAG